MRGKVGLTAAWEFFGEVDREEIQVSRVFESAGSPLTHEGGLKHDCPLGELAGACAHGAEGTQQVTASENPEGRGKPSAMCKRERTEFCGAG